MEKCLRFVLKRRLSARDRCKGVSQQTRVEFQANDDLGSGIKLELTRCCLSRISSWYEICTRYDVRFVSSRELR